MADGLRRALGTMSGTSMDGVDLALLETDGRAVLRMGPTLATAYTDLERDLLRQALRDAVPMTRRDERPGALAEAEAMVTTRHAEAVRAFLSANSLAPAQIDVIGFHGQTVLHRPALGLTVQIGDGERPARESGVAVVTCAPSTSPRAGRARRWCRCSTRPWPWGAASPYPARY